MGQIKKLVPASTRDRIAERIDGIMPEGFIRNQSANIISATGAGLVVAGSVIDAKGLRKTGAAMRCVGETADDVDGDWARRFNIASATGALVDATLDKVKVAAEVYTLWNHANSISPIESARRRRRIAFVAAKHGLNAALNVYITARGGEAASSQAGKANMWADGLFFGGATIADSTDWPRVQAVGNVISDIGFVSGAVIGTVATIGYAKQAFEVSQSPQEPISDVQQLAVDRALISGHGLGS